MQLHNEIIAIVFIVCFIYFLFIRLNYIFVIISLTLAILVKFIFGLFLIPFFLFLYKNRLELHSKQVVKIITGVILSFTIIYISYKPFIIDFKDVLLPLKSLSIMGTHGSLKDIMHALFEGIGFAKGNDIFNIFIILFICIILFNYFKINRLRHTILPSILIFSLFFCFYSHRFFPWYLLVIYPLFIFKIDLFSTTWRDWFILICLGYCLQDISVQIPHDSIVYHVNIGISTAIGLFGIFYKFKKRYLIYEDER